GDLVFARFTPSNPLAPSFCSAGRPRRSQTADAPADRTPFSPLTGVAWNSMTARDEPMAHRAGTAPGPWACIRGGEDIAGAVLVLGRPRHNARGPTRIL